MTSYASGAPFVPFLTYELFYGLTEKPFGLSADPRFLYQGPAHAAAFDRLLAGIRRRDGLIVVTGETGTGKTTLCRAVLERLDHGTFSTFVHDPFLTREDLMKTLLVGFGAMSHEDLKSGRLEGASRQDLSYPLYAFLDSLAALPAFALLVIDEAQNLSLPVIEEIRILSERDHGQTLQIVLVGQPGLRDRLTLPHLQQINQRVSVRCELTSLDAAGVEAYVGHRLSVAAGARGCHARFSPSAFDAIGRASKGLPRLVNLICDRALLVACAAERFDIDAEVVQRAIAELEIGRASTRLSPRDTPLEGLDGFAPAEDGDPPVTELVLEDLSSALGEFSSEPAPPVRAETKHPVADRRAAREIFACPPFEYRRAPSSLVAAAIACWLAFLVIGGGLWYLSVRGGHARTTELPTPSGEPRGSTAPAAPKREAWVGPPNRVWQPGSVNLAD